MSRLAGLELTLIQLPRLLFYLLLIRILSTPSSTAIPQNVEEVIMSLISDIKEEETGLLERSMCGSCKRLALACLSPFTKSKVCRRDVQAIVMPITRAAGY